MTNWQDNSVARHIACRSCGAPFICNPAGPCWCFEEAVRLPMPDEGADCLCRDCLRKAAARPEN